MDAQKSHSENGQILLLLAVGLVVLLGLVALAIDGGAVFLDRRTAQNAADAAALAGAYKLAVNPWDMQTDLTALTARIDDASQQRAHDNNYGSADGKTVVVYYPPDASTIRFVDNDTEVKHYVRVTITSTVNTSFLHFVFNGPVVNTVEAVAHVTLPTFDNPFNGTGLVALKPHDCSGLTVGGNLFANLIGGGIFVNTDNSSCAVTGGSTSTFLYTPAMDVVGGFDQSINSHLIPPYLIVDPGPLKSPDAAAKVPYPPVIGMPPLPTCSTAAKKQGTWTDPIDGVVYDHWYPGYRTGFPSGNAYFDPGIYCITINNGGQGSINNSQRLVGDRVLFAISGNNPCNVTINGLPVIKLTGYDVKPYDGLLIYVDPNSYSAWYNSASSDGTFTFNGSEDSYITGTIFAPSCSLKLNGTGGSFYRGQLIGFDITLTGTNTINMLFVEDDNLKIQTPSKVDLNQ